MKTLAIIAGIIAGIAFGAIGGCSQRAKAQDSEYNEFVTARGLVCVSMRGLSYGEQPALSCVKP